LYRLRAALPGAGIQLETRAIQWDTFSMTILRQASPNYFRSSRMILPFRASMLLMIALFASFAAAASEWTVRGKILDEQGQPVPGAAVSSYWGGNGKRLRADGTRIKFPIANKADLPVLWSHIGEMEPASVETSTTTEKMAPSRSKRKLIRCS
jgi:hypothetical protein